LRPNGNEPVRQNENKKKKPVRHIKPVKLVMKPRRDGCWQRKVLKPTKISGLCNSLKPNRRRYVQPGNFNWERGIATARRRERRHASNCVRSRKVLWKGTRKPELPKKLDDLKRKKKPSER
jgi:hypothetical protein